MQLLKNKKSIKNSNQRGFSLIEILIASGIMSALLLYLYQTLANQQKVARKVEVRLETDAILSDIRQTLGIRESCISSLSGKNAASTAIGNITRVNHVILDPANPLIPLATVPKFLSNTNFDLAPTFGSARVRVISYSLSATDPTDPSIKMIAGTTSGSTNLIINFRYNMIDPAIVRKMRIDVITASSTDRTIVSCTSTGAIADFDARYVNAVGDSMTGTLKMTLNSNIEILGTGTIIMSSDERLKKNIRPLVNVTSKINKLRPVSYLWKEDDKPASGLIAQEVQEIFPQLVHQRSNSDLLAIDYLQLSPYIIKGMQETNAENVLLRKKMKSLNNELNLVKEYLCQKDPQSSLCANSEIKR